VVKEFGLPATCNWGALRYLRRYPQLVAIGLTYNASIWADKLLFALSPEGEVAAGCFATYGPYDSSMFLAFLGTVPAIALFLARTETDFADAYRQYYDDVFFRRSYDEILRSKRVLARALRRSFADLIKVQGLVTFLLLYFANDLLEFLGLPFGQTAIFRFGLLGAMMQVLMSSIHVVLLYFDLRGTVVALTATFLLSNLGFTALSIDLGYAYYGAGFAAACFVSLAASVVLLYQRIGSLEYITFARRRIVGQTTARRRHRARRSGMYGKYQDVRC
jgi:uncharacterized membrane protein